MDELYADRSGSIRKNSADPEELSPPARRLRRSSTLDGRPVGCGGFKRFDDEHVARSSGCTWRPRSGPRTSASACSTRSRIVWDESAGYSVARLDTGDRQPSGEAPLPAARATGRSATTTATRYAHFWFEKYL